MYSVCSQYCGSSTGYIAFQFRTRWFQADQQRNEYRDGRHRPATAGCDAEDRERVQPHLGLRVANVRDGVAVRVVPGVPVDDVRGVRGRLATGLVGPNPGAEELRDPLVLTPDQRLLGEEDGGVAVGGERRVAVGADLIVHILVQRPDVAVVRAGGIQVVTRPGGFSR